jgi:predicted Fe-Mo cluster-binding NifX family protein
MNVCIPIDEARGLLSPVSAHFASAPAFLIIDTETLAYRPVGNQRARAGERARAGTSKPHPLCDLLRETLDLFIVSGIGTRALALLASRSVPVLRTRRGNVADALAGLIAGTLDPLTRDPLPPHRRDAAAAATG